MKSIIEEIFYGKCGSAENIDFGKEYWEAHKKCGEIYEKLEKGLNAKQKKILNKMFWAEAEQESEAIRSFYMAGFKIGFLIAVECFTE